MFFSKTNSSVKSHFVLMALYIEDDYNHQIYGRKYYLVQNEDNTEQIYLTTNEPVTGYDKYDLDEDFIQISGFDQMLDDFEKTELIGLVIPSEFNGPPKYIYYNIITINDLIKPYILSHLNNSVSGFTALDLNQIEKDQIKLWTNYLSS